MRVRTILGAALVTVMSVACKKPDVSKVDPHPQESETLYVKAIKAYNGMPGYSEYDSSLAFEVDSEKRITSIRSTWTDEGVEYADPVIDIEYGEGTATISYLFDGESGNIKCELNDNGAIVKAVHDGEMMGLVEEFSYNDAGEIQRYSARLATMTMMSIDYEWKDGNIFKVSCDDSEDQFVFTHEYTDEPNIYNIDIFPGCTMAMPILCEFALPVNDGLLGKKNHGFLKSIEIEGYVIPVFDYTFKANGELEYATMDEDGYMVFECYEVL